MNAVTIQYRKPILHRSNEVFCEFFTFPQFLLCLLALGDVNEHPRGGKGRTLKAALFGDGIRQRPPPLDVTMIVIKQSDYALQFPR